MRCTKSPSLRTIPGVGTAPNIVGNLALCSILLACAGPVLGAKLRVPSAALPTIQAAIDMARPYDDIEVAPGTYQETINFRGKAVRLYGRKGAPATTIDAGGSGSVVTCENGETSATILEGFTITGGNAENGGGMLNWDGSPTVIDCIFRGNSATWGGGMLNYDDSSPTVINCIFRDNSAIISGGAMYNGDNSPIVTNCIFLDNAADGVAGGMYNYFTGVLVTNCTFVRNSAFAGGAMLNWYGNPVIMNCIFWFSSGGEIYDESDAVVAYSDIQGGFPGEGNIDADPLFDATGHLQAGSPCIDAGNDAAVPDGIKTDLAGGRRIRGTGVDMGAYESRYRVR